MAAQFEFIHLLSLLIFLFQEYWLEGAIWTNNYVVMAISIDIGSSGQTEPKSYLLVDIINKF